MLVDVMASSCIEGGSGWLLGEVFSPQEQSGSGTAPMECGLTVLGAVTEPWGCGTKGRVNGHGGVGRVGLDPRGLLQP